MSYNKVPFGTSDTFNVVIEIPKGSKNKYEYDEKLDAIKLDWVFTDGFCFPFDYGYIPETKAGDGDHLDVFVFSSHQIAIGSVVECRPIGMIEFLDRGEKDNKILAVPLVDPEYQKHKELSDLSFDYQTIFKDFFKELGIQKNKTVEIKGFRDKAIAVKELELSNKNYN
ncbi:inorganic diphosphatase [Patescibacteria group bacterium]